MSKQQMYFQINNGPEMAFATIEEDKPFILTISKFATDEDLSRSNVYPIVFKDGAGNSFKFFSKPLKNE